MSEVRVRYVGNILEISLSEFLRASGQWLPNLSPKSC